MLAARGTQSSEHIYKSDGTCRGWDLSLRLLLLAALYPLVVTFSKYNLSIGPHLWPAHCASGGCCLGKLLLLDGAAVKTKGGAGQSGAHSSIPSLPFAWRLGRITSFSEHRLLLASWQRHGRAGVPDT